MLCAAVSVSAQDIIHLTDGSSIKAKVVKITDSEVEYRKFTNPTGPVYTVMRDKIGKIVYENGDTDVMNEVVTSQGVNPGRDEGAFAPNRTELNEYELLRMVETEKLALMPVQYKKRAKTYKLIGWIGGSFIFSGGVITLLAASQKDWLFNEIGLPVGLPVMAAGIGWCVGWNIAANKIMNKARLAETYSAPVAEVDLVKFGKSSLRGSVNLMGNQLTRNHAVGLGLTLSL